MNVEKKYRNRHESIYNKIILNEIIEAEHYLAIFKSLSAGENDKAKNLLKDYMLCISSKFISGKLDVPECRLDAEYVSRKAKIIKEISDILKE